MIMINEVMLPREGLYNRTFSVLAEIKYQNKTTKLAEIKSGLHPPLLKRLTEKKEAVPQSSVWNSVASYIYDTKRNLKRIKLSGILSISEYKAT